MSTKTLTDRKLLHALMVCDAIGLNEYVTACPENEFPVSGDEQALTGLTIR